MKWNWENIAVPRAISRAGSTLEEICPNGVINRLTRLIRLHPGIASKQEIKNLKSQLRRKEALAENSSALVLSKKSRAIWGSRRRLISSEDRQMAISLLTKRSPGEQAGVPACSILGISV